MKNQEGFTLVELVVVVGCIAIILAIVTLNFTRLNEKYTVETDIREIYANLMRARDTATKTNVNQRIVVGANQILIGADADRDNAFDGAFTTFNYTRLGLVANQTNVMNFDTRGLIDTDQFIQATGFPAASQPAIDCIDVRGTRLNVGLMTGGACVSR